MFEFMGRFHPASRYAIAVLLLTLSWQTIAVASDGDRSRRPNVVVILADDMGYGDLSSYDGWIRTPHLDALAASGMRFTDFHSSGAVCSPTRAGFVTGRYQQRAGIPGVVTAKGHRDKGMPLQEFTIAELLKQSGYTTALFGKWHLGYQPKYNPIHQGFDLFRGYVSGNVDYFSHLDQTGVHDWWHQDRLVKEEGYVTHLITKYSVEFIRQHKDQPFFLYIAHEAVHAPYQGPNDKAERLPGREPSNRSRRQDRKETYREMVTEMDAGIGQIVQTLREQQLLENTLIFFFTDNGATQLGSNGKLRGHKGSVWEGGHRVPAIASWPGRIQPGSQTSQLAISLDLFPTIAAATHTNIPEGAPALDGANLLPLLTEQQNLGLRTLFWRHGNQRAVRQGEWKLVLMGENKQPRPLLFNLATDIEESNDLSAEHPKLIQQLLEQLHQWEADVGPDRFGS